jgi:hypothetical protein
MLKCEILVEFCHLERLLREKYGIKIATNTPTLGFDWLNIRLAPDLPGPNSYVNGRMSVRVSNLVPLLPFLIYVLVTLHAVLDYTAITRQ